MPCILHVSITVAIITCRIYHPITSQNQKWQVLNVNIWYPFGDPMLNLENLFKDFGLEKIRLNLGIARVDLSFKQADEEAAWELYVEMLTRVVTQRLPSESGDEQAALDSVHALFLITREILRQHGKKTIKFSKVAIPILNQAVRPFTTKWHKESLSGAFNKENKRQEFRMELKALLDDMRKYNRMLAKIAKVEDLTDLEPIGDA